MSLDLLFDMLQWTCYLICCYVIRLVELCCAVVGLSKLRKYVADLLNYVAYVFGLRNMLLLCNECITCICNYVYAYAAVLCAYAAVLYI